MIVETVNSRRAMRAFVRFPARLYRDDACWAPPLWLEERTAYNARHNTILAHSDFELHLVRRNGRVAGRNLVYVDHAFNAHTKSRTGFFGALECDEDPEAAAALLEKAETWLMERGMDKVRGPIHPVAENWGFLLEGYDRPPVFMAPYNPPYVHDFLLARGYAKVMDLLAYEGDARTYDLPERFSRFKSLLLKRKPGLTVRRLDLKNLSKDAEHIWRISNNALKDNWGYVPLNRDELEQMIQKLKLIVDTDAVWFVEDKGRPVGYALGFPDLNIILRRIKGRLLPFGFARLLVERRRLRDYRLWALAVEPEYHNLGLDVLLYLSLFEALGPRGIHLEANYILEDNHKIRNALEKLNLEHSKTYRIYEKRLAPAGAG
jgi:GNAT superfamily N-acetyltransferase